MSPSFLLRISGAVLLVALASFQTSAQSAGVSRKTYRVPDTSDPSQLLRAKAQSEMDQKDFEAAAADWKLYLAQQPNDAASHFQLAYTDTELKKKDEARAEFEKAAALDPKMSEAWINLGLLLLDSQPKDAVAPLTRAVALLPDQPRPHLLLGWALERSGQLSQAADEYRQAAKLAPASFDAHLFLARTLLASKDAAAAESEFRAALALRAASAPALLGLAQSLLAQKKSDDAAQALGKYLDAAPQDAANRLQYASLLLAAGKADAALAQLNLLPADSVAALELRATALASRKDAAGAVAALARAASLAPGDESLRARFGHMLLEQKNYPGAVHELAAAFRLNPQDNDVLRDLGAAHYLAGDYPGTLTATALLLQREPPTPGLWFTRATCFDKLGQLKDALAAYQTFLTLNAGKENDQYFVAAARARALQREIHEH